jgi:hypothetical protein
MDWSMVTVIAVPAGTEVAACVKVVRPKEKAKTDTENRVRKLIYVTSS